MNTSHGTDIPLGFRLRLVDRLISREFESAFAAEGVGRREWRALEVIAGSSPAAAGSRGHRGGRGIRSLVERGWVERGDAGLALTDAGAAVKARLDALADDVRARVAGAVPADDLDTLMRSLDAIARELGWDESQPMPGRPDRGRGKRHGDRRGGHGFGPRFRGGAGEHGAPGHCGYEQAQRD